MKNAYFLLVAAGIAFSGWSLYALHSSIVGRDRGVLGQADSDAADPDAAPPPPRVSVTDKHLRTCRRFCRIHHQYPVRRIDVQGSSVRCVCSGASAPDAEVSE